MIARRSMSILATALVMLLTMALPARAQITTGSVGGTVKDVQGGVIPGATVTLVSETRGTRSTPIVTGSTGDFVFANVPVDTYTVEVSMPSFKTLQRKGVAVNAGERNTLGALTIEVGGASETVEVKGEAPTIQATTYERSFTIETDSVANLPIANRSFTALTALTPGVSGTSRIGGGGGNNIMMDGVSAVDTGSNSILLQMNIESIAEVKVLTSNYQAEYGRSSGLQVTAVTKSGTNRFRGSLYDVERNSDWNANSRTNILNGNPKTVLRERDWGYTIGGPIGKPGASNKLFFFYSHEYAPRQAGNDVQQFRMPTALERQGDYSQTYDNNGNLFRYIKDPSLTAPCATTATGNHAGCFQDGGVLGRIPANRLYGPGVNILNIYPLPNIDGTGLPYNYQITRPNENALAWQPAVRVDYQPFHSLRGTFKYSGWQERNQTFNGSIPGFNDTRMQNPLVTTTAYTINWTISPTMFLESTFGHSQNELAGCALAQGGTGPTFCTSAIPMDPVSNKNTAGLGGLPMLFPNALTLNPSYYAYQVLTAVNPPFFVNGQILRTPNFAWGNRIANAPPNIPFAGYLNINSTHDLSVSLTKVAGRHTIKSGFYLTHSFKAQQQGNPFGTYTFSNDTSNPLDAQFGYANAVLGVVDSLAQQSTYIEGSYKYNNIEGYLQDNWKVSPKLTLDYGVRLIHQQPQYDSLEQASNFFPDQWTLSAAPQLYVSGCTTVVAAGAACPSANRQAVNPLTGQGLGANTAFAIGALVPNTGNTLNGLKVSGQGIVPTTYTYPNLGVEPRFGMAYDVSGKQRMVFRGGVGLFFDRPSGNDIYGQVSNPPALQNVTLQFGQLQAISSSVAAAGAPSLNVYQYDAKLPSSFQGNGGIQMTLPWATTVDVEYVGQHAWYQPQTFNINAVDFGTAFLPQYQDPTLVSATPGAAAVVSNLMRAYRGYGGISRRMSAGWNTYHSVQISFNRRFRNGVSFGFNDTIGLQTRSNSNPRLQHNADGSYTFLADQARADLLLNTDPTRHTMKANFVWQLPGIKSAQPALKAIGLVVNDWQLSGIWTAATGGVYTVSQNYQNGGGNVNLTGSPDYGARVRIVGDTGAGCSSDVYRQFTAAGFQGPLTGSVGLESGANYLHGCFSSVLDLAIARNIRLPKGRTIQLRADLFNAPNTAQITGRNTTMNLSSPNDPVNITNLAFDPTTGLLNNGVNLLSTGDVSKDRSLPKNAGFGVANAYQAARSVQVQIRFSF